MAEIKHDIVESDASGFPSHFLSPKKKETPEYAFQWLSNMHASDKLGNTSYKLFKGRASEISELRAYARGDQSIEQYKPILGVKGKTRKNPNPNSYKVLDWSILDVASKFVNLLVGRLIAQDNSIGVNSVDKRALDERRQKKISLQEYVINKPFLDNISKQTGIQFETPIQEDVVPMPESLGDVDIHMEMFYKEEYCLVLQDFLKLLNEQDDYNEILKEIATDLVEVGMAATKTYTVGRRIRRRNCKIERMVAGHSTKANFEDCPWMGEYWDLTVGELKEIAGAQFTEKQYKLIAEQSGNTSFGSYDSSENSDYYNKNNCYPWDSTKVTVLDGTWTSPDEKVYQVKKNGEIYEKDYDWWKNLRGKGVTEQSFNDVNESQVLIQPLNNWYEGMWIVNTKFIFNHGLAKNMLKDETTLGRAIGPFCIYRTKKSVIETIKSILNNIQINWIQYQHHAAKSRPAGLDIEFTALQDISLEGAGGKKLTPKQALEIYFDTGILLWRRKDAAGNMSNFRPINELNNGLSQASAQHFQNVINNIDLLRGMIGENELTDASTPNSEMGKHVANLATGGNRDAQKWLHFAFDQVNIGTQHRTVMHISGMASVGMAADYSEALGGQSMSFLSAMSDIGAHSYGAYLMKQPTEEMRARLSMYVQNGIKNGTLYEEEAFEIENEPNIYRSIRLLKKYRQDKMKAKQAQDQAMMEAEMQKNTESVKAAEAEKRATAEQTNKSKIELAWEQAKAKVWESKQTVSDEAFLLNLKTKLATNQAVTEEEQRRLTELAKGDQQGQYQLAVARLNASKAANTPKKAS